MNIVVTSPKTVDLMHKVEAPSESFWSLKRRPKKLKVGDVVWIVKNGYVVGGFSVRKIVFAKNPVRNAVGHNPSEVWRIWFGELIDDVELQEYGILDEKGDPQIKVRGFQGFRYQWWTRKEAES